MKNKFIYITIAFVALGLTSCKKYFEVDNSDRNTLPLTFSSMEGFRAGIVGTYGIMHDYYSTQFYIYPEVAGNMVDITKTGSITVMRQQHDFASDPEEEIQAVGYIWRRILVTIANANNIIEYAPALEIKNDAEQKELDAIVAQALFIRALSHFDLCRVYAQPYNFTANASHVGVPIVLSNPAPEDAIGRSTVKEVYTQVEADLKEAEKLFGSFVPESPYYASKKAVQALLARVYLYAENWDEAINYSSEVINSSMLATGSDYREMFHILAPGKETIFRLNGKLRNLNLGEAYSLNDPIYAPADTLMSLFDDPADIRLQLFQMNPENNAKFFTTKWTITGNNTPGVIHYDPMVLRTSEMYFIRAEANLKKERLGLCSDDLKVIIGRALNQNPTDIILNETAEALKQTIIKERAKEFCFEGHNFFDSNRMKQTLVRGATTTSLIKKIDYPSDRFVLPIPQSEIDANPAMRGNPTINK